MSAASDDNNPLQDNSATDDPDPDPDPESDLDASYRLISFHSDSESEPDIPSQPQPEPAFPILCNGDGIPNPNPNGVSFSTLDLNGRMDEEAEEEVEREKEREASIWRAFREDESRRNAPLTAENATRVMHAMRRVRFPGSTPEWVDQVAEDRWVDRLRRLRGESTAATLQS